MKILFINKHDTHGGAAIAAWRLQETLQGKYHTDNQILCGIKHSDCARVFATRKKGIENFLERGINFGLCQAGLQYFWFPFSTKRILRLTSEFQPDIISLHNIHGGFFKTSLLEKLSDIAPLVWTLHDMWAFTANGAYTGGDDSWKRMKSGKDERKQFPAIGLNTGNYLLQRKKRIYANSRLSIACPSKWMQEQAGQSPALSGKDIHHIPNGVNLNRFCPPKDKAQVRQTLGITPDQKILLLFSEKVFGDERKGGNGLLTMLKKLDTIDNNDVVLLTIGGGKLPLTLQHIKLQSLGYLSEEHQIIKALQASDLFVFPTREDNLPNTLVEAIACGLPCVTYDVGGCGEIIKDGVNGILVNSGDTEAFFNGIKQLLQQPERLQSLSLNARKYAAENFDVQLMAKRYYDLFTLLVVSSPLND